MTTYFSPGVYIEEVPSGPQPIAAAPTSVVAIVGTTERGPRLDPTRITGWADYQTKFGRPVPRLFTAEAVYGFFENGGPAAYVVRVDPSITAEWTVTDSAAAEVFRVRASVQGTDGPVDSPGAWAGRLAVTVAPDTGGGSGSAFQTTVDAATAIPDGVDTAVQVGSTEGVQIGHTVVFVSETASTAATVVNIAAGPPRLTVNQATGAAVNVAIGDRVAGNAPVGALQVQLAIGNGILGGDLLLAELPDRERVTALVAASVSTGAGLRVDLDGPLGTAIPGTQFTDRTARFAGQIAGAGTTVALGTITQWQVGDALRPRIADILSTDYRAIAANGVQGSWNPGIGAGAFDFGAVTPPDGTIEVEAAVRLHEYVDAINLTNPSLADLSTRYGFVPDGTQIVLEDAGAANTATLTRGAGTFATADSLNHTFEVARFVLPADATLGVVARCAVAPVVGDVVDFGGGDELAVTSVDNPSGHTYVLGFTDAVDISAAAGPFPVRAFQQTRFLPLRFSLAVTEDGTEVERYPRLALDPDHPRYYFRDDIINEESQLIRVTERDVNLAITEAAMPAVATLTTPGSDVAADHNDLKAGIATLERETEPAMVICPDALGLAEPLLRADVIGSMITHCENFRRFAIVDSPDEGNDQALADWRLANVSSTYAATFAPHLRIANLIPDVPELFRLVPPSGFVAGVFARTDRERGVHKAPGNERIRGIVGLSQLYTQRRQDLLNPAGVNLIRVFPGRGTRIWGARNSTDDVTWRYVNVRRLFNFIENSVERGTQWVVFEPNTTATWLRVQVSVENFLDQLWRAGALAGTSAEQAYRVRVGLGVTMTETDIDLGLIIIEVAVAPAKPAEFVVFRFSHKRLSE